MKLAVSLCLIAFMVTSCTSQSKYEEAKRKAAYWENRYESLESSYNELYDNHAALKANYEELQGSYNYVYSEYVRCFNLAQENENLAEEREDIINRAKDAVSTLKRKFSYFSSGWGGYDTYDIEREIREVENKLDGWL